jgi:hypothetical protein
MLRGLSAPVQAIIAPTIAAVEHAPRADRTDLRENHRTDKRKSDRTRLSAF